MKLDIEYSNNVDSAINVLSNPDVAAFFRWYAEVCSLSEVYDDKKSLDLALKIYDIIGLSQFLTDKHTYKELEEFYDQIRPVNIDERFPRFNASKFKDEPEDDEEVEVEEFDVEEEEEQDGSTFAKESVSYNADITEDVKQRAEVIKTTNEKRAALKARKLNVK